SPITIATTIARCSAADSAMPPGIAPGSADSGVSPRSSTMTLIAADPRFPRSAPAAARRRRLVLRGLGDQRHLAEPGRAYEAHHLQHLAVVDVLVAAHIEHGIGVG